LKYERTVSLVSLGVWGETISGEYIPKELMLDLLNSHFLVFNVRFLERNVQKRHDALYHVPLGLYQK
jgi:hypothetical protein